MASTPLKVVTTAPIASALTKLLIEMDALRCEIGQIVGDNAGIDLSLGKDGLSFDMTITLNAGDEGHIPEYLLKKQPIPGVFFNNVAVRPVPHTVKRRMVIATLIAQTGGGF